MEQSKSFKHIMVDLETMGNKSNSCIVSIGALEFDLDTGETGREFYYNIHLESCLDCGLTVDAHTVMWWLQQSDQARTDLLKTPIVSLNEALISFNKFCNEDSIMWGNSARFDLGILQDAYNKLGIYKHWNYHNERDVRTLVSFAPEIKKDYPRSATAHNALSDCYHQAGYCSEIWISLKQAIEFKNKTQLT